MKGSTHLIFGSCTGIAACVLATEYPLVGKAMFLGSCIVGSLFPDFDIPTSSAGKYIKPISIILNKMFGHRAFMHSPAFFGLLYLITYLLKTQRGVVVPTVCIAGFALGFFGHLILDTLTIGGVPWLYPFTRKHFHILSINTGDKAEPYVAFLTFILFIVLIIKRDALQIQFNLIISKIRLMTMSVINNFKIGNISLGN